MKFSMKLSTNINYVTIVGKLQYFHFKDSFKTAKISNPTQKSVKLNYWFFVRGRYGITFSIS